MERQEEVLQLWEVQTHCLTLQEPKGDERRDTRGVKKSRRPVSPQLASQNKYSILYRQNKIDSDHCTKREVRQTLKLLRKI